MIVTPIQLVTNNPGDAHGGIPRYVRELYTRLAQRLDVALTTSIDPPLVSKAAFLHHLPLGVRGRQPGSIVHFMQLMGSAQMLWRPIRPVVATIHDLGPLVCHADEPACRGLDRMIFNLQLAGLTRMDRLIAVSEFTRRGLVSQLGIDTDRVHVVHHGVEHGLFRVIGGAHALLLEQYPALARGDRVAHDLLYVGNELPRKNLGALLRALAVLKGRGVPVRLIKVGGAGGQFWRSRFLAEMQALGVADDVVVVEGVPDADLPLFYNAADLYVTTSVMEGFGWPVLEAMACGVPVVCSAAASLPEIVGDAALLVDPDDPHALAATIARALANPELRAALRLRGLDRAASFTWERTVERTLEVYELLASTTPALQTGVTRVKRHKVNQS